MKDFFKTLLACLAALFVAGGIAMFMLLVVFGALASSGDVKPGVRDGSMLVFDLSVNVTDAPTADDEEMFSKILGGGGPGKVQLRKLVEAIDGAATDDRIRGIFLYGNFSPADLGSGYPALLEVRNALKRFRDSGKPVVAYVVGASTRDYFVASAANRLVMNPMGLLSIPGFSAEVMYLGGTFEKFGIGVQVSKAGEYKSFGEAYTERHMSGQEREQLTALLGDLWGEWMSVVSEARGLPEERLQTLIDDHSVFSFDQAIELGLVDEGSSFSDLLSDLKEFTGEKAGAKTFRQVALKNYMAAREASPGGSYSSPRVAVVYAEGNIVDGEGSTGSVGGDKFARELRELRADDKVAAVVLRVNSPGGSAIASEVIRRELELLHAEKPLVVSMGTVAASGGYWIATESDRVFAQRSTITGSIGVVMMIPNIKGLGEKLELNVENVRTSRNAGLLSIAEPRSEEGMAILQTLVDDTYDKFIDRVVDGRGMERGAVEKIAGGRVWSGADALERELVDEIGGLKEAIAHAAALAELDEYRVIDYPAAESFFQHVLKRLEDDTNPMTGRGPAQELRSYVADGLRAMEVFNDPTDVYAIMPQIVRIR